MAENTEEQIEVITTGQTEDVTDKKCPNCGATVVYDPDTLSMTCPFCGYSRTLPKPEDNGQDVEELDFASARTVRASTGVKKRNLWSARTAALRPSWIPLTRLSVVLIAVQRR